MKMPRICASICVLLLTSSLAWAQRTDADTARVMGIQPPKVVSGQSTKKAPLFSGVSVSYDLCGTVMALATPFGQYEAAVRVNLRQRFFPIVEIGLGTSDHEDEDTHLRYKTTSPYFRVGMDYNLLKNFENRSRVLLGLRFGMSPYKFDLTGPAVQDPVYMDYYPFEYKGQKSTMVWAEVVAGAETRIWKWFHLGWSVRYKLRLHESKPEVGNAWYVPGYGKTGGHRLGGTFNVIIEI